MFETFPKEQLRCVEKVIEQDEGGRLNDLFYTRCGIYP